MGDLFLLVAIDVAGLVAIWLLLKARLRKALEIEGLLAEARKELRLLSIEINETTDRNVTLVEDRLGSLRELLAEADRRMGVMKRETGRRQDEAELYNRLGRRLPVAVRPGEEEATGPRPRSAAGQKAEALANATAKAPAGTVPELPFSPGPRPQATAGEAQDGGGRPAPERRDAAEEEAVPLAFGRSLPDVVTARESVIPQKTKRERALELHRGGFSADLIAARLGATISEIELLVSLEEGREAGSGDEPGAES